jgi:hypothetical protein
LIAGWVPVALAAALGMLAWTHLTGEHRAPRGVGDPRDAGPRRRLDRGLRRLAGACRGRPVRRRSRRAASAATGPRRRRSRPAASPIPWRSHPAPR